MKKIELIFILFLILLSAFLYTYRLGLYPPSVHCDEILPTLYGQSLIKSGFSRLIGVSWFDIPNLVFFPYGIINSLLGNNVFAARFPSAIVGILTVVSFYFLVKILFNLRTAVISSLLLVASHWWLATARSGIINIQTVLPEILAFYFLFKGFAKNKSIYFVLTGFFTSLGLYLYLNSRIIPLIIFVFFLHQFILKQNKVIILKQFLIWLFFALIFYLPMIVFYKDNPQSFLSRSTITFIFSDDQSIERHMTSVYGTNNRITWVMGNLKKSFDISDNFKDENWQYGYKGRVMNPILIGLFIIGQIISLIKIKKLEKFLILGWFWISYIILGILTVNIALPRLVGIIPVLYIFPAFAIDRSLDFFNRFLKNKIIINTFKLILFFLILFLVLENLKIYFLDNPKNKLPIFNKNTETLLAEYYYKDNYRHKIIVITEPYILPDWCLIPLTMPKLKPYSIKNGEDIPNITGPKIFAILKIYPEMLSKVQIKYPSGIITELGDAYIFTTNN